VPDARALISPAFRERPPAAERGRRAVALAGGGSESARQRARSEPTLPPDRGLHDHRPLGREVVEVAVGAAVAEASAG
jgi:hypothetical protein